MKTVDVAWPARIVANHQTILRPTDFISTKPTNSLASDSTDFGRWNRESDCTSMLENLTLSVEWSVWHGREAVSRNVRLRDGMSPRRRRLHFSRLPACDPVSTQCVVSIHMLLNYFRLTLYRFRAIYLHHLHAWLQSRVSSLSKLNSSCANF